MARRANEKRRHLRVEAKLAMQLAEETLGDALVTTESLNISRGGVYCESPEYLAPLSKVALTVILPPLGRAARARMLRSEGVVVRCEPLPVLRGRKRYQLACCFTGLDGESRAILDEFVSWRALRGRAAALARAVQPKAARVPAARAARVARKKSTRTAKPRAAASAKTARKSARTGAAKGRTPGGRARS